MAEFNSQISSNSLPPQNIEAEESILGGILLDPQAMGEIIDLIVPEAFYVKANRDIYEAALKLYSQGKPTDLMTVTTWLQDHGLLEKVGGTSKLAQLVNRTVSAVNIDRYTDLVMNKYRRRQLIAAGNEIVNLGYDTATELETVLDLSEQKIFSLTQDRLQQGLVPIADTLVQTFNEIEKRHQKTTLPGITSSFYDLDAFTSGFQRSDLIIVAGRPSMGKCLEAKSEIVLADGSVATIEDIYRRRHAQLLTLNDNWKFSFTQPSAFVDDGIKPVFRVTTKLGRFIETTITHPYLTIQGWRRLSELKPGDKIAVPRKIDVFGTETISECEVKLLGYLIGDGCLIWGKDSHTKTIPEVVFRLKRSLLALFLNCLFATNGWATVLKSGQSKVGCATVSEKLARQVQHLLLRFGVIAALNKRSVKYNGTLRKAWQLDITDAQSIKSFIDEIGIFGQGSALSSVQEALEKKKDKTNCDLIPGEIWEQIAAAKGDINIHVSKSALSRENLFTLALALDNLPLQQLATSEVYWDEIVSIEPVGNKQVYDLTIPETHNFVANDISVHNTSFALNIAYNIAKEHQLPVAIFSLEMSKEQLAQRLLASESRIPSNRLRSGRIAQTDLEPLVRALGTLSGLPIYIDDTANLTVMHMRSEARRLQAEKDKQLGLILLDYLQLMEGGGKENRVQELSRITRSLKGLARELNVPIIALSQLSRGVEQRTNKRPMMSDLRESGSIEQDADLVIMLYRDEYYHPDTPDQGLAEVIIAKHRNGPIGIAKLLFDAEVTKFLNMQKRQNYE
ncbi:MAG: replicative DNA helicase [Xenococcaceae cyanobacterium]